MQLRRSYAVFLRYMYLLRANPQRIFSLLVWVALDVVLWGFITKYLNGVSEATFSFVPVLLGAIILSDFLSRVQQGVSMPFLEDVWSRNLINYFASPLDLQEYLFGLIMTSVFTTTLAFIAMALFAFALFGFSLLQFGGALAAFLLILFLFGIALGIFGTSIVLKLGPSGEWYIWPLITVLTPFVGVFYPISVLPQWMQMVSHLLPPSYVFESARDLVTGAPVSQTGLVVGIALALVYILASYAFFHYVYRTAVKSGSIMRYYAENLE